MSTGAVIVPAGWKLVPVEPTEDMVVDGFESWPDPFFSSQEDWEKYEAMSGCQQAAHRARLCYAAMLAAAPVAPTVAMGELRPSDDDLWDKTLRDRDTYHDCADSLAEAIAKYFGVDIGEHSSQNCPWAEALEVIQSAELVGGAK